MELSTTKPFQEAPQGVIDGVVNHQAIPGGPTSDWRVAVSGCNGSFFTFRLQNWCRIFRKNVKVAKIYRFFYTGPLIITKIINIFSYTQTNNEMMT